MRNNSAWNQRWFAAHRGSQQPLDAENVRLEADYAIKGAELDPYNESSWRYLIGIVREEPSLTAEYEKKAAGLRQVLVDAERDPDGCANLTSARIDMLEMLGDDESLKLVCYPIMRAITVPMALFRSQHRDCFLCWLSRRLKWPKAWRQSTILFERSTGRLEPRK